MKLKRIYQCGRDFFRSPRSTWLALTIATLPSVSFAKGTEEKLEENVFAKEITVPNDTINHLGSIPEDTLDLTEALNDSAAMPDTLATDSMSAQTFNAEQRIMSLADDAIYVIAQFEGVKCRAYRDKNARGLPTIGIGNTVHANGRRVRIGDCLKSEEELIECVKVHIKDRIVPIMSRTLDIEHMGDAQIVSLIDLAYNCGAGVFEKKGEPTDLAKNLNAFVQTGDSLALKDLDTYFKLKVYAGGKRLPALEKRRAAEFRMFVKNDHDLLKACREANLGVMYSMKAQDIREEEDLSSQLKEITVGYNLTDTISNQVNMLPIRYRKGKGR